MAPFKKNREGGEGARRRIVCKLLVNEARDSPRFPDAAAHFVCTVNSQPCSTRRMTAHVSRRRLIAQTRCFSNT